MRRLFIAWKAIMLTENGSHAMTQRVQPVGRRGPDEQAVL
jgi:hypothetical protein